MALGDLPYYTDVTIQSSKIISDLTDLVITINGSDLSPDFFAEARSDGGDVRACNAAETIEYPIHIAHFDSVAATARIVVRNSGITFSGTDTVIRLKYGDAAETMYARTATYGAEAVYANCKLAASIADGASDYTDYASDDLTSFIGGSPSEYTSSSPWDGNGVHLSNGKYVGWTSVANTRQANNFTWTMWHKTVTEPTSWNPMLCFSGASNPPYGFTLQRDKTNDYYRMVKYVNNSVYAAAIEPTASYTSVPTDWLFFSATQSSTDGMKLWINAVEEAHNTVSNGSAYNTNVDYSSDGNDDPILSYWRANDYADGAYTGVYMWDSVLSDDFISALYRNQDTSTFYSVGTHSSSTPAPSSATTPPQAIVLL